ncbi:MAG TPA: PorV/PorQ family protein [bacterium (Candidatus Stahlbacteria)]|nr:PorV/PorQ family protein [Candidatus Stahlbacteria bacterium]
MRLTRLLIIFAISLPLTADFAKLGTAGAQFLKITVGRGSAMGEAFVAVSDDASATYWNPAGLARLAKKDLFLHHNEWLGDLRHDYAAFALPMPGFGTMGFSFIALTMGNMEYTTVDNPQTSAREDTGTGIYFSAMDFAFGISYARMFTDKLSGGLTVKTIHQRIWDMSASGIAFDIGTFYDTGFRSLRIAASLSNFGSDMAFHGGKLYDTKVPEYENGEITREPVAIEWRTREFPLPITFRLGIADNLISNETSVLTAALDLIHPNDTYESIALGLEYGYLKMLFVRIGYRLYTNLDYMAQLTGGEEIVDEETGEITGYKWSREWDRAINNLSAGIGLYWVSGNLGFRLSYCYMNKGILTHTHRIGLGITF